MYYIINRTSLEVSRVEGHFPDLEPLLNEGNDIIVISTYSNTIKTPIRVVENGIVNWEWEDQLFY